MRRLNLYRNSAPSREIESMVVTGQMGDRDRNTGRYRTTLDNGGLVPTRNISRTTSRATGFDTEVDLQGWGDS